MGNCQDCRFWIEEPYGSYWPPDWRACDRAIQTIDGKPSLCAPGLVWSQLSPQLATAPTFGCVMFEAKSDG